LNDMFIHFFCLCPRDLTFKLNFNILKVTYFISQNLIKSLHWMLTVEYLKDCSGKHCISSLFGVKKPRLLSVWVINVVCNII